MDLSDDGAVSAEELDAMSLRCAAAGRGPWRASLEGRDHMSGSDLISRGTADARIADLEITGATKEDYDFIAHAKQDVRRLIVEVRRLRAKYEADAE